MLPSSWIELSGVLPSFFLVLGRMSGLMITAPLYGSTAIPAQLKAALVLVLSTMLYPMVMPTLPPSLSLSAAVNGIGGELLIGLLIGVSMSAVLLATQMSGMIVGQQAGLALASAFDPSTETSSSVIGQIYFFTATTVFLVVGGHRAILQVLMDSFATIPVMTFGMNHAVLDLMVEIMVVALQLTLRLAGPMIIALLLAKAGLGFLSRTMPQLHILSVGFAIFVCIGMFLSGFEVTNLNDLLFPEIWDTIAGLHRVLSEP